MADEGDNAQVEVAAEGEVNAGEEEQQALTDDGAEEAQQDGQEQDLYVDDPDARPITNDGEYDEYAQGPGDDMDQASAHDGFGVEHLMSQHQTSDLSLLSTPFDAPQGGLDDDMPMANRFELLSARSRSASSRASRPGSAMINLRGSRPNSAAIAQEIEGFEDDFMERVEEEEEVEVEPESEDEEDLGPTVEELIERAQQEQQRLVEQNEMLQKRVRMALDMRNKGRPQVNRDMSRLDGVSTRYRSALKLWVDTLEDRDRVEGHYQTTIFDMKSSLEERIKRADDISKAYKHFRLEVAKSAEHSKTGKPISERLLAQLEQEDQEKEEEVQRVRLKNIHLSNQLKRIEATLRQKEELAEGLHLIDFEQLKIENQSLNEKIEERNEELLKLRKKTMTTVQILTHVREKLQFVEKENGSLSGQLEELDGVLAEKRDRLGKAKAHRDTLRQKGRKIKEGSVFITNHQLLDDIDVQKEKKEVLSFRIEDLKKEYGTLSDSISKTNQRIIAVTGELAATGAPNVLGMLRSMPLQKTAR
mmetsp:Transcript_23724/g.52066  ORF Transcript_23724/g.52066 Transcript_23724/m.52066 type:complete len:532 (-) Transcript_23724:212-1807(-)|eukprot:CAMPEP_0202902722 /NCGR_PEP_ID=MMETSP1392-20130828/17016_1 /ASSEMBLY_ACC=CAM_ASM_000868 /TAXON_ID=225041 /ORGANISM="Chlamydomonas chlamydogama, Strain SAG 11-48b" /LENGTH=531 /DNA_ID=CAMNT_0049589529 /DNA_START=186 /DNA_END=1781 /DNA_ORIENTATION=-